MDAPLHKAGPERRKETRVLWTEKQGAATAQHPRDRSVGKPTALRKARGRFERSVFQADQYTAPDSLSGSRSGKGRQNIATLDTL
ncbi:MAG: hypothetical protein OSB34_13235 [Planktomarina sp.]|nr:hypothetical protein [Planktomarina sp.]